MARKKYSPENQPHLCVDDDSIFDDGTPVRVLPGVAIETENDEILQKIEKEALEALGLNIDWEPLSAAEKETLLHSPSRTAAFENIDTTTNPRQAKIREKQGIVSEILRKELIPAGILKDFPTVYLGSGDDIEYVLALGARKIELVDTIFSDESVLDNFFRKLNPLVGDTIEVTDDGVIQAQFDFGDGPEPITIKLADKPYYQEEMMHEKPDSVYELPNQIGTAVLFASQGPSGSIQLTRDIEDKIVENGVALAGRVLCTYASDEHMTLALGEKRPE
ncbi:hypothetical protein H6758_02245 [Candidatus Nomurabacteria bacterium]|nr:hypothetical protein [Candidatus Nomurabacteria bacterium]